MALKVLASARRLSSYGVSSCSVLSACVSLEPVNCILVGSLDRIKDTVLSTVALWLCNTLLGEQTQRHSAQAPALPGTGNRHYAAITDLMLR